MIEKIQVKKKKTKGIYMFEADDKKKEGRIEFADGQKTTKRYLEFRLSTRQKRKKKLYCEKKKKRKLNFLQLKSKTLRRI